MPHLSLPCSLIFPACCDVLSRPTLHRNTRLRSCLLQAFNTLYAPLEHGVKPDVCQSRCPLLSNVVVFVPLKVISRCFPVPWPMLVCLDFTGLILEHQYFPVCTHHAPIGETSKGVCTCVCMCVCMHVCLCVHNPCPLQWGVHAV